MEMYLRNGSITLKDLIPKIRQIKLFLKKSYNEMGKESLYELTLYHILTTNEKLFLFVHLKNQSLKYIILIYQTT